MAFVLFFVVLAFVFVCFLAYFFLFSFEGGQSIDEEGHGGLGRWTELRCMI